jgi:hypothetical protein
MNVITPTTESVPTETAGRPPDEELREIDAGINKVRYLQEH